MALRAGAGTQDFAVETQGAGAHEVLGELAAHPGDGLVMQPRARLRRQGERLAQAGGKRRGVLGGEQEAGALGEDLLARAAMVTGDHRSAHRLRPATGDRKRAGYGKWVSVSLAPGGRSIIK